MNPGSAPDDLSARLVGLGLARGGVAGPFGGQAVEVWLRDGEPAVAVLVDGDPDEIEGLRRIAWSLGCSAAFAVQRGRVVLIETAVPPTEPAPPRVLGPGRIDTVPAQVPGVVRALVRLAETWRERLLRRCLAGHHDWTEAGLNLAVEAEIAGLLVGTAREGASASRMQAELVAAGVVLAAVPPGLLALAWDLHLSRGVRLDGADASITDRPPTDRTGPDRVALRLFATWAETDAEDADRVLVPACGAGRLLLACGHWAATHIIQLYALDPDPRAVIFAVALLEREFGGRLDCTIRVGHPLVGADLDDDPLARLMPDDARARLGPADWEILFDGVDRFDRVLIADPAVPLTRRTAVRRYVEGRYATAGAGTDPASLLIEAGAGHLAPGGRVLALYRAAAYRVPSAAAFRRWLAPRTDALIDIYEYCAVRAAAEPIASPIFTGGFRDGSLALRSHPRSALDTRSWTVTDTIRAGLLARLEADGAPLGDLLLGGVREPAPVAMDPALLIDAPTRRLLLRADRRAVRAIRPLIAPEDVTRFSTERAADRFAVAGPLPPRARRIALDLNLEPPAADLLPPPAGPRLLFAEGARTPAFLCDRFGRTVPMAGVGTIAPADPFLAGLLHAAPVAVLIAERCPRGLTARCLAKLSVRIPDTYDERERRAGEEIAALFRERMALTYRNGHGTEARCREIEDALDRAVEQFYRIPSC